MSLLHKEDRICWRKCPDVPTAVQEDLLRKCPKVVTTVNKSASLRARVDKEERYVLTSSKGEKYLR